MSRISQIRNLRDQCKSLNPVSTSDDTRWYIQLVDKDMHELYKIFLYIPRDFPTSPPQITLSAALDHVWVNQATKVVQHPRVMTWDPRCDLSSVILDVLREFTTKKPKILHGDVLRRESVQSSASQSSPSLIEVVSMPPLPQEFPELKALALDDMEMMDRNSSHLDAFVDSMPLIVKYHKMKEAEGADCLMQAHAATRQKEKVDSLQNQIQTDFESIACTRAELEKVMQERDSIMSHYTPKYLSKDLTLLAEKADRESAAFIETETLTEESRSKFLQQRILYHKAMAFSELLTVHSGSKILGSPRSALR